MLVWGVAIVNGESESVAICYGERSEGVAICYGERSEGVAVGHKCACVCVCVCVRRR